MITFGDYENKNKTEHNSKWLYIPDHPYRTLIIGGSGSGITSASLKLIIISQTLIEFIYTEKIHMKQNIKWYDDISKYDPKAFIEYSNDMQDVYKNIEEYNLGKKRKILIVFDDMIADMINTKKT